MRPLPKVVFDHFRAPRCKGQVEDPSARGEISGRSPDSRLQLCWRLDAAERIELVRFESEGDRGSDAPLSLLASELQGMSLEAAEALTAEQLAEAYGLGDEHLPMLLPAWELLQATLANQRGDPNPYAFEGGLVCTCLSVREGRIRRAIRERRLTTLSEVSFWTRACTGCRSCRPEILRLLKAELGRDEP